MTVAVALYDSFSSSLFGGSQVYVISDASSIPAHRRQTIARELGAPACCFIDGIDGNNISVQFFSTVTELPMCGHGSLGLMTHLDDVGLIDWAGDDFIQATLTLPGTTAVIDLHHGENGRLVSMLNVRIPEFRLDTVNRAELAAILSINAEDFSTLPIETAVGDFIHLIVPLKSLSVMQKLRPDFAAIVAFCHDIGVQTIACFSLETEATGAAIHVRDFCPAVGVAESAAAGTTNAALAAYLFRNQLVTADEQGNCNVIAEQGLEINRPSTIYSKITIVEKKITTCRSVVSPRKSWSATFF